MKPQPILDEDNKRIGFYWLCTCGWTVEAFGYDVCCEECGKMYNAFGQELRPKSQWEEQDDY